MANQITLEEALALVDFELRLEGWQVKHVKGNVCGNVWGDVWGDVWLDVFGTISGRHWKFIETPKEKLKRLIEEGANKQEILKALDQLEDSDD